MNDEQRRLVANRLRECRGGWSSGECYYTIIQALGLPDTSREDGGHALYSALADLIDPDESVPGEVCEIEGTGEGDPLPPIVDRESLLELAEDVTEAAAMATVMDASEGAKLLAELLLDIARHIREACEEVES